jgi:hypothetical protein
MLNIIKAILNNSNSIDDQSQSLNCLWNLVFDDKISEFVKKDKDILSLISNFKNLSPSEEIRRITAGIMFTLNEIKKSNYKTLFINKYSNKYNQFFISFAYSKSRRTLK